MKKRIILINIGLFFIFLPYLHANAQSIPVNTPAIEDAYRRAQLAGELDSSYSFTIRPVYPSGLRNNKNVFDPDSSLANESLSKFNGIVRSRSNKAMIQLLPLYWQQQYNAKSPYGWNDGAMIPSRGYQTLISAGIFAKLGPLSIQLRPEYVYAKNKEFDGFAGNRPDGDFIYYFRYNNAIDLPERFGQAAYSRFNWGQSSIRLTAGPVSAGISNENIWWGPGLSNSLLMTNNAEGFKHITLNTLKPIRTPIGSLEAQIIAGRLEGSGFDPFDIQQSPIAEVYYIPRKEDWRYLSAIALSYQPKWVPGLFLGFTRGFQAYHGDLRNFSDYFPLFTPYQKVNTDDGDPFDRDQLTSVYARWLFTRAKAEVYFEFGKNDNAFNIRDFLMSLEHSRAYVFGLRKLVPLKNRPNQYLQLNAEVTQMQQSIDRLLRDASAWYLHFQVRHGYTNKGQVLGAGIGPGGNVQSAGVSWINGLKQVGLQVERLVHNNDLYNYAFNTDGDSRRQWVDLGAAAHAEWDYKNFIISTKIQVISTLNYQWRQKGFDPSTYYIPENDVMNFHGQLGLMYRF